MCPSSVRWRPVQRVGVRGDRSQLVGQLGPSKRSCSPVSGAVHCIDRSWKPRQHCEWAVIIASLATVLLPARTVNHRASLRSRRILKTAYYRVTASTDDCFKSPTLSRKVCFLCRCWSQVVKSGPCWSHCSQTRVTASWSPPSTATEREAARQLRAKPVSQTHEKKPRCGRTAFEIVADLTHFL